MSLPSVFMIGWEFPPHNSGGLGIACKGLTSSLVKERVRQIFVLPKQLPIDSPFVEITSPLSPYFSQIHVNLPMFPYGGITEEQRLYLKRRGVTGVKDMVDEAYVYADMIGGLALNHSFDIIHGHDWMTYPAALRSREVSGKPLVLHVHSTEFDRTLDGKTNQAIADIEYDGLQKADKVITVSQYTKDLICDKYAVDPYKVEVVHNGVDLSEQAQFDISNDELGRFAANKKIVSFMGRLTCQKGPDYFIKIADKIAQAVPDTLFVLGGNGDMYESSIMQSASNRLTGKLLFAGFLRGRQKEFIYRRSDLFVMPSVSEPFGIVALEAAATGTPVLISKQSGVREVMPYAYTADFWDIDAFSNEAIRLLNDYDQRVWLGGMNAEQVKEVNWDVAAAKCVNIYKQLY